MVLLSPTILASAYMILKGRKLRSQAIAQLVRSDTRPAVIYLRSFSSDTPDWFEITKGFLGGISTLLSSPEEDLAEAVTDIGPAITVGKPGEFLPTPGAARVYIKEEIWHDAVEERLLASQLIILRAGNSPGLWWELAQCVSHVRPERFLILVQRMPRAKYNEFAARVRADLKLNIPSISSTFGWPIVSGIIAFQRNWEPCFLPLKAPIFRTSVNRPLRDSFRYALKPVYANLGVRWTPPNISYAKVFATFLFSFLFFATLLEFL